MRRRPESAPKDHVWLRYLFSLLMLMPGFSALAQNRSGEEVQSRSSAISQDIDEILTGEEQESAEVVYAYISTLPDRLYFGPSYDAESVENRLLYQNTGSQDRLSDRYQVMVGDLYRFRIEGDWAQILPDNGRLDPFTNELDEHTYLPLKHLQLLGAKDFEPIPGGPSSKRLIVVFRDESPRIAVFEGTRVVMHVPAFLGRGGQAGSLTPTGDFRVYYTRASDNMPSFTGVPFVSYFTGDKAFHEYHGWNWPYLNHGGYGSQGCVNLPDNRWFTAVAGDEQISAAQWLYRWISSVPQLDYDEENPATESAFLDSNSPGWHDTSASIRVLVVSSTDDWYNYIPPARLDPSLPFVSWDDHVAAYQEAEDSWILPTERNGVRDAETFGRQQLPPPAP